MEISADILDQANTNSLYQSIGIRIEKAAEGRAHSILTPRPEVCWPLPSQPHGGILFTFMDTTMGWAVNTYLEVGYNCTTIDCNIQYLSQAKGNHFFCQAWVTHQTGRMAFVQADIRDAQNTLLAIGQAVFRIVKRNS